MPDRAGLTSNISPDIRSCVLCIAYDGMNNVKTHFLSILVFLLAHTQFLDSAFTNNMIY